MLCDLVPSNVSECNTTVIQTPECVTVCKVFISSRPCKCRKIWRPQMTQNDSASANQTFGLKEFFSSSSSSSSGFCFSYKAACLVKICSPAGGSRQRLPPPSAHRPSLPARLPHPPREAHLRLRREGGQGTNLIITYQTRVNSSPDNVSSCLIFLLSSQFLGHLTWVSVSLNPSSRDELLQLLDTARVRNQTEHLQSITNNVGTI